MAAPDRIEVTTAVAIRGASGFFFGTLRWIEATRLLVEIDAALEQGDDVDVRITLAPTTSTALVNAVVARPLVTAKDESPRYILDIVRVSANERALIDDWTRNVKNHGTFSTFKTVLTAPHSGESAGGQSNAEVRAALARMARRPMGAAGAPLSDAFDFPSDIVTGDTSGAGRGAMRDALRGAIARGASTRSAPVPAPPSVPSMPPPRAAAPLPSTPARAPAPSTAPAPPTGPVPPTAPRAPSRDPAYATTATRDAQWMEVRWHDPAKFDQDCRTQLCNYMLVLQRGPDALPRLEPLRVVLRHGDLLVECAATVTAHTANAAYYRLQLDALQIERLRNWAADYGRK